MLQGYESVERIDFEKEKGDNVSDVLEKLVSLMNGETADRAFTMTVFILEKPSAE
jgi:hypothetical protein